jgi:glyceraldehyde-3-phosphate dehydrogenase/erythrose-4-phosphate dehydrogenase
VQVDYTGLNVHQVWECTGVFLTRKALQPYFDNGVPKVVVSAPVKEDVLNIVYGVNHVSWVGRCHFMRFCFCLDYIKFLYTFLFEYFLLNFLYLFYWIAG